MPKSPLREERVSHLTEVFHQSDNMLRGLTDKNLTYLHMWGENLQDISGEDDIRDYIEKALECGMNGFLSKPIVIEELLSTLQKNLYECL